MCPLHPVDAFKDPCALKGIVISRAEQRECFPNLRASPGMDVDPSVA